MRKSFVNLIVLSKKINARPYGLMIANRAPNRKNSAIKRVDASSLISLHAILCDSNTILALFGIDFGSVDSDRL